MKLEIARSGGSAGSILPKDLMGRLSLAIGDELAVTAPPDQGMPLARQDEKHEPVMRIARTVMQDNRDTLEAPAKRAYPTGRPSPLDVDMHGGQLAEFGGPAGVRDDRANQRCQTNCALQSALDRTRNKHANGTKELSQLAADDAHRVLRDQPFVDGNTRASFMTRAVLIHPQRSGVRSR